MRVVILEDVTTTGGSSMKAIEAVRADGAEIERVITGGRPPRGCRRRLQGRQRSSSRRS